MAIIMSLREFVDEHSNGSMSLVVVCSIYGAIGYPVQSFQEV